MLRACVLTYGDNWEDSLPYAEFAYNNGYQTSLQMTPFEALYGRKCRTPLGWSETGDGKIFGPDILKEAEEQVKFIQERLRTAQSRQKSYADKKRRDVEFQPEDYVYLKVTPLKGMQRFSVKGKLAPRYIGPFKVLDRRGKVAYQLELPLELSEIHDVFHVSQLKKCLVKPTQPVSYQDLDIGKDLTYPEQPMRILDTAERRTRNKTTQFYKVQWSNHSEDEATWERAEELRDKYPSLFQTIESRGRDSF
jgi:hypothetical protein